MIYGNHDSKYEITRHLCSCGLNGSDTVLNGYVNILWPWCQTGAEEPDRQLALRVES